MHLSSPVRSLASLPALFVSAVAAASIPIAASDFELSSRSAASDSAALLESLQIDSNSAQASFFVPCFNCLGDSKETLSTNQSFLFNLQAFPSEKPCGTSNLTLNGVSLTQEWESTGVHAQGLASVNSSGHELNLFLRSDCLYGAEGISAPSATQLLTFTIEKVNNQIIKSISGFSLSFKQAPSPELLRLSVAPEFEARDQPYSEGWRNPPANLRLIPVSEDPEDLARQLTIADHIEDLNRLEAQVVLLQKLIDEKKGFIKAEFNQGAHALQEEVKHCASLACIIKAIGRKVRAAAHVVYLKFHPTQPRFTTEYSTAGSQAPTKMAVSVDIPQAPDVARCADGKPSCRPTIQLCRNCRNETALDEKNGSGLTVASVHTLNTEQTYRDAQPPSNWALLVKTVLFITGIAFLIALCKRRCMSLRKQTERAADRERRNAERLYKCQSRKQAWKDWWHGRRRGSPGRRPGDYDEKRALILQQEGILEGIAQDEISQLQIQAEIENLRRTRDQVDDIIRAEEGRSRYPTAYPSGSGTSQHPRSLSRVPTPITIPNVASVIYPPQHHHRTTHSVYNTPNPRIHNPFASPEEDESDSEMPMSPVSRTSSLPDYKTEASNRSEPPAYDDHDDMVNDGFSDYAPSSTMSSHDGEDGWSPGSSIPDISPRPSIETTRTFF
ncbi:gb [Venturia nashicola]|uniref:Gb n=1 Tax=Venturia nashicola TaxID=86259 RepID=A0A4Z1PAA6_9PEZI|nr:gb [Venturia nashicola]TLD38285.1 gb [Venturia nashicola]